ncbi:alkylated DNA repair protein [Babesia caballi]|uniref:Alkylated DNA repair protein n=1 Tax=Babesia caballi TaxID=5871 RepID=A0AAV4LWE7_BABCB|nr:alkylated DNA repair protein [Babesia caballi]
MYDWGARSYRGFTEFPEPLVNLTRQLLSHFNDDYVPDAAIINCYTKGYFLRLHKDDAEETDDTVVNISLGAPAIFAIGGRDHSTVPAAMVVDSGSVVLMARDSRFCLHGVVKLLSYKKPGCHDEAGDDKDEAVQRRDPLRTKVRARRPPARQDAQPRSQGLRQHQAREAACGESVGRLQKGAEQVVDNLRRDDAFAAEVAVAEHVAADLLGIRRTRAVQAVLQKVQVLDVHVVGALTQAASGEVRVEMVHAPAEEAQRLGAEENLVQRVAPDGPATHQVADEVELVVRNRVQRVGGFHVVVHQRHGNVEVPPLLEHHAHEQRNGGDDAGGLAVAQLRLAAAELDAPRDGVGALADGRRLETDGVPVGALERLEVRVGGVDVDLVEVLLVRHERVAGHDGREVPRYDAVEPGADAGLVDLGARLHGHVVQPLVVRQQVGLPRNVKRNRREPRKGHQLLLLVPSVVHGLREHSPARRVERQGALENRRRRRHRQKERGQDRQLVVEVPSLELVHAAEGGLQAAHTHAEHHGVHVYVLARKLGGLASDDLAHVVGSHEPVNLIAEGGVTEVACLTQEQRGQ